jgi:uncharacterized protein YdeI (YjbR/CyaY-like superfamily)
LRPENVVFFDSQAQFRTWLEANHDKLEFQWVGFYKRAAQRASLEYNDAVEEALCFGWIDGQGAGIDEISRAIRFTPRRKGSIWSNVNVRRMNDLIERGRVAPSGLAAFEARRADRVGVYSSENPPAVFSDELEARFRANPASWEFWSKQPPGYRRQMTWWVMNAKRDETKTRRMDALIEQHATGQRIEPTRLPKVSER